MRIGLLTSFAVICGTMPLLTPLPRFEREAAAEDAPPCAAWQIDYVLNATVNISDTIMGAGDGNFPTGPGKLVLRFENRGGEPGGNVKLLDYQMKDGFTVVTRAVGFETRVTADTISRTTTDGCGVAADGAVTGRTLRWKTPWNGMRSDGSVICGGSFCGRFGAPPTGRSDVHVPPHNVDFKSFEYSEDKRTFTMPMSLVSRMSYPSQTSRIAISGREVSRTCVAVRPCP